MVARKQGGRPKKEKPKILGPMPRKVRRSLKLENLDDVIVDGRFACEEGDLLILRKDFLKDVTTSYITVMEVNEEEGWLNCWDETQQQWAPRLRLDEAQHWTLKREPRK